MLKTSDFDFELPLELIAQEPFFPREKTKMLVCKDAKILDAQLSNLTDLLQEGDVLVFNNARVIKAQFSAKILRSSALLDFNLDQQIEGHNGMWRALCRPAKKVIAGDVLQIADKFIADVIEKTADGFINLKFDCEGDELMEKIAKHGSIPLPPYIKRSDLNSEISSKDEKNYQTIYAAGGAAVAAPTAGLHFDEKLFAELDVKKIQKAFVTLNVGAGTFLPVRSEFLADHAMHRESFSLSQEAAEIINSAKARGKKIIAVGTTSLRVLESCADEKGLLKPTNSSTAIFIHPPYKFKIVDVLMTNFHLPKSTLFMLVCAFVGKEKAFEIYNHAIANKYRFYSYGDSSLLFCKK